MSYIHHFTFNGFAENTYIVWDDTKECVIIDPGNSSVSEHNAVKQFIADNGLTLKRLLLTHAHLDHVLGNKFIHDTYGLLPEVHKEDLVFIHRQMDAATMYGVNCEQSPVPTSFLKEGDSISFGTTSFEMIHVPGHSPGSLAFYNKEEAYIIVGDVLFYESIGRSDLPMGNHDTLIASIKNELFKLPDAVKVYNGHGPSTTIGHEKTYNPFLV